MISCLPCLEIFNSIIAKIERTEIEIFRVIQSVAHCLVINLLNSGICGDLYSIIRSQRSVVFFVAFHLFILDTIACSSHLSSRILSFPY